MLFTASKAILDWLRRIDGLETARLARVRRATIALPSGDPSSSRDRNANEFTVQLTNNTLTVRFALVVPCCTIPIDRLRGRPYGLVQTIFRRWPAIKPPSHFSSDRPVKRGRFLKDIENLTCAVHATPPRLPDSRDNVQHFQPVDRPLGRRECHVQSGG